MTRAYIYHVIGTLKVDHIFDSLRSMQRQEFHWERFILYNASNISSQFILNQLDKSKFDSIEEFAYDPSTPKSAVADWEVQMKNISGADRYLVHKADFYLPINTCTDIDALTKDNWFLLFRKFDMKEKANFKDFEAFADRTWEENYNLPETGRYPQPHYGKLAVPADIMDGTMHAYTDSVRKFFKPSDEERKARWGIANSILDMRKHVPVIFDDKFFAIHMFHDTPHRGDAIKLVPGERF